MNKDKPLIQLIHKLREDNILKAPTFDGAWRVFYHHLSKGRIKLRYVQTGDRTRMYLWSDKEYTKIVEQLNKCLRGTPAKNDTERIERMVKMRENGATYAEIAKKEGLSRGYTFNIISKHTS